MLAARIFPPDLTPVLSWRVPRGQQLVVFRPQTRERTGEESGRRTRPVSRFLAAVAARARDSMQTQILHRFESTLSPEMQPRFFFDTSRPIRPRPVSMCFLLGWSKTAFLRYPALSLRTLPESNSIPSRSFFACFPLESWSARLSHLHRDAGADAAGS